MNIMADNKYEVVSHKFIGFTDYGNGGGSYTYEIAFNRSLEHTGKFSGIEDGLNRYDKKEPWQELRLSLKRSWWMLTLGIKRLIR